MNAPLKRVLMVLCVWLAATACGCVAGWLLAVVPSNPYLEAPSAGSPDAVHKLVFIGGAWGGAVGLMLSGSVVWLLRGSGRAGPPPPGGPMFG